MKQNSNSDSYKDLSLEIKNKAISLGLDHCGISAVRFLEEDHQRLTSWLNKGFNAGMTYMDRNLEKRTDPSLLVENSKSVIITGLNYFQSIEYKDDSLRISKYALGKDYHKILKDKLYGLLEFIKSIVPETDGRVFVDSAPVLERTWAVESGLGWIGKNGMLINKNSGSYIFLGVIITSLELEFDESFAFDHCGSCTKCIESCPTKAIIDGRIIDSNKCISYLTIENRNEIPSEFKGKFEGYVFGCDICQDVCPWNMKAKPTKENNLKPLPEILSYTREQWQNITEDQFDEIFSESPVLRAGFECFKRNLSF